MGGDGHTVKLEVDYTNLGHQVAWNHWEAMRPPVLERWEEKTI